ncbi:hypothetical protein SAMN05216464_10927 [Mucilaginibacter pineti]|uniref:Uncharacterized protein n=1 Tax=Mucilaginibacter pineti TaxID=1391627 RepID=A0A1G7FEV2_9SPHI|nr:hypothetical protein SAMN05216464_10927 [Mucilaginibacter pineti]
MQMKAGVIGVTKNISKKEASFLLENDASFVLKQLPKIR